MALRVPGRAPLLLPPPTLSPCPSRPPTPSPCPSRLLPPPPPPQVLMPTLVSVCYGSERACATLAQHMDLHLLQAYLQVGAAGCVYLRVWLWLCVAVAVAVRVCVEVWRCGGVVDTSPN